MCKLILIGDSTLTFSLFQAAFKQVQNADFPTVEAFTKVYRVGCFCFNMLLKFYSTQRKQISLWLCFS